MPAPTRAALVTLVLSASAASAQPFLEFQVMVTGNNQFSGVPDTHVMFVLDASEPFPNPIPSTLRGMNQTADSVIAPTLNTSSFAFSLDNDSMSVFYIATYGSGQSVQLSLFLDGGPGRDPDNSVPDNPASYTGWTSGSASISSTESIAAPTWSPGTGFDGGSFSFSVREVPDPNPPMPEGCNAADLAPPFGVLDFSDVVAYLSAFGAGCP